MTFEFGTAKATGRPARYGVVGEQGFVSEPEEGVRVWTFPGVAGTILHAPASDGADEFAWPWTHIRVTALFLMDQTDRHNELVHEREWLLWPREATFSLACSVLSVEDVLTGEGRAFLRLAPLPHARSGSSGGAPSGVEGTGGAGVSAAAEAAPNGTAPDFEVDASKGLVRIFRTGFPVAGVAYRGGRTGRIRALHAAQRRIRRYEPGRDGLFVSNTWGDRSRDARIREDFLLREIEAGARLGVDVVQIDDGWECGRSVNSAAAAAGATQGSWDGYWACDPRFWDPDPERFPNGLGPVVAAARARGMRFGLWFGPDSSHDAENWRRDADRLLELHRRDGIDYVKIDSLKTRSPLALRRQRALFDRLLEESGGRLVTDLDVTAELRPGYFGLPDIGPLFVENRYTDWHNHWPHQTLRTLWSLAQAVDPVRLRMEVLNPLRTRDAYAGDPLAPAAYRADTLFAIAMAGSPLGWFETSGLAEETIAEMRPLVDVWKRERARFHGGGAVPVLAKPDGVSWTGFVSGDEDGRGGYALLFRELDPGEECALDVTDILPGARCAGVLAGRGTASLADGILRVRIPAPLDYLWVRMETDGPSS